MKRWIIKPGQKLTAELLRYEQEAKEREIESRFADLFESDTGEIWWNGLSIEKAFLPGQTSWCVTVNPGVFLVKSQRVEIPEGEVKVIRTIVQGSDGYYNDDSGNVFFLPLPSSPETWDTYYVLIKPIDVRVTNDTVRSGYYITETDTPEKVRQFIDEGFLLIAWIKVSEGDWKWSRPKVGDEVSTPPEYELKQLKIDPFKFSTKVLKADVSNVLGRVPLSLKISTEHGNEGLELDTEQGISFVYANKILHLLGLKEALRHPHVIDSEEQILENSLPIQRITRGSWSRKVHRKPSGYRVYVQRIGVENTNQLHEIQIRNFPLDSVCLVSILSASVGYTLEIEESENEGKKDFTIRTTKVGKYEAYILYKL